MCSHPEQTTGPSWCDEAFPQLYSCSLRTSLVVNSLIDGGMQFYLKCFYSLEFMSTWQYTILYGETFFFSFYVLLKGKTCISNTSLNVAEILPDVTVSISLLSGPVPVGSLVTLCLTLYDNMCLIMSFPIIHTGNSRSGLHNPLILLIEYEIKGLFCPYVYVCVFVFDICDLYDRFRCFKYFVYMCLLVCVLPTTHMVSMWLDWPFQLLI